MGQGSTLTVTLPVAAPAAGVTVTLANGTPSVATLAASSVTIPQGQQSATVAVTTLGPGTATITGSAAGFSDGAAALTVILPPPTVIGFAPTSGKVGDSVTVSGTFFFNPSAVTFNGVTAPGFTVNSLTSLTVPVPTGATTGPIAVTTSAGTGTSSGSFVVIPTQDFQLTALPNTVSVPSAGQGAFNISLTGSGGFTGLTTLAASGVPAGATPTFAAATLTGGQSTLLTVATAGTTPAGSYPFTVTASGLLNGVQTTRSANLTLQVQAAGVTSLTGQVLDEDAMPVKGAVVKFGTLQTTTDDAGNFLLLNPPVGPDQLLFIDGGPASTPGKSLPIIPYKVTIVAGQANTLGFTPYLHFQKTTNLVDISNSSVQRVVTDPTLPGYQMTIPLGITILGWDGQPNTQVSIRRVPTDRAPLPPFPADRYSPTLFMYYFGKQGGGTPSAPVPITYPNDLDIPPGTQVELWFYDEAPDGSRPNAWAQYGTGTVSADGSQVIPDTDPSTGKPFGQPRFCCGAGRIARSLAIQAALNAQRGGQPTGACATGKCAGKPVDLATGILVEPQTDLVLPGRIPLVFTRSYRTNGAGVGPFGPGTSHTHHVLLLVEQAQRTVLFPDGGRAAFTRQADGTFQNFTHPRVRGAVLRQQAPGHVLRFKDGTTWAFDANGFLVTQTDRNGNTLTLTRSGALGQLNAITEPSGRQLTLTNEVIGVVPRVTSVTDPIGRTVTYTYNPSGSLASVTDPAGNQTQYTYDTQGRMLTVTDPRGNTAVTNAYDANGRVAQQTLADGATIKFAYTVIAGVVTQTVVTDPRGNPTTYRFNGQGYLLSQTEALGQTSTHTRDPATNLLLATTDSLGRATRFGYDTSGNLISITNPQGNAWGLAYEPNFNQVASVTDPLGNLTRSTYDAAGNLTTATDPLGSATQLAYDSFGQPLTITDALGNVRGFTYTPQGDLTTARDALGNAANLAYDIVSRLTGVTDARGKTGTFTYDALDRTLSAVDPLGGTRAFSYDANSNPVGITDPRGNTIQYEYDSMDRVTRRVDPLGQVEILTYDPNGNVRTATDRKGQITQFTYDALDRRVRTEFADGSVVARTYDPAGRLVRLDDTADPYRPVILEYDSLDRLVAETSSHGRVTYAYDALGRRTQMTVAGQAPVTYTYDAGSRLTSLAQAPLNPATFEYDALDRRTRLTLPSGVSTEYQYDAASRLTALVYRNAAGALGDLQYAYDPAGNRVGVGGTFARTLLPNPVATATYDAANRQLAFSPKALAYDPNGNLTSLTDPGGTTTLTWDARDRLVGLSGPGMTAAFTYGAGRRRSKTINSQLIEALHDVANTVQETIQGTPVPYLSSLGIDEPLVRNGTESYLADGLGSTLALTDEGGAVSTQYSYEPFGRTGVAGAPSANPFQFTGRENDGTGLYYYRARYYAPTSGRFISEDPVLFGGWFGGRDVNLYSYVENRPLNYFDPAGLLGVLVGVGGSAEGGVVAVGGGVTASAAYGLFGGGPRGLNFGGFASFGGFLGGPRYGPCYPGDHQGNVAGGAYIGGGLQISVTNAKTASDLAGRFDTRSFNVGIGPYKFSVQYSWSGDTRILSIGPPIPFTGVGIGISGSGYATNSWTTR